MFQDFPDFIDACARNYRSSLSVRNIPKFKDRREIIDRVYQSEISLNLKTGQLVTRHCSTNETARLCLSKRRSSDQKF